jgi:membrane protein YdbS with pleckstrin-like domain
MASTQTDPTEPAVPVTTVSTADLGSSPTKTLPAGTDPLYNSGIPEPPGTEPGEKAREKEGETTDPTQGLGVDGEDVVWEARYSKRNFIGRILFRSLLTVGWIVLAFATWGYGHENWAILAWVGLAVVMGLWLTLIYRMIQAHYSHYYRLTNRRLFVSTGVIHRRRDMMELLRVKDVFTRQQSLMERWMSLGTVVVVPNEKDIPTFYLAGVDDPKGVMDLIWHHARAERDVRSVKVDQIG